jgi:hypothetical protein
MSLPTWLKFSEASLTYSGKSTEIGLLVIRLQVFDTYLANVFQDFELEIYNEPP